jgi:purine-binding chemotaxis protein CheW
MIRELITFEVEGQVFGLDIMSIREIRAWSPTTRLPRVPSCRGRGQPARHRAARGRSCRPPRLEPDRTHPRHAIIVTQMDAQIGGWIVDAVSDIVTVPEEALQPPRPAPATTRSFRSSKACRHRRTHGHGSQPRRAEQRSPARRSRLTHGGYR